MARKFKTEGEFVNWLRRRAGAAVRGLRLGIGDDAALIRPSLGRDLIVTADQSIDGVHFLKSLHPPEAVGYRALARSLSDIAAMGGKPLFALISVALPRRASGRWIEQFYSGVFRLARRFGVSVIGGDTAVTPHATYADVVVIGEAPKGRVLLRSGARPGDAIYVAGVLGLSALGLRLLRSNPKMARRSAAVRAHLYPEPQCRLGEYLGAEPLASAAIDLSDGLSIDLRRLAKSSGVGVKVWEDSIPKPRMAGADVGSGTSNLLLALNGGEDYKLLFTSPPAKAKRLPKCFEGIRLYCIGEVCASGRGVTLVNRNGKQRRLAALGYDHFRLN